MGVTQTVGGTQRGGRCPARCSSSAGEKNTSTSDLFDEIRTNSDLGAAHAAVSPRLPNPSNTSVARTEDYTHATNEWALCLVQGPFSRESSDQQIAERRES